MKRIKQSKKITIGIIGFGNFSKLMIKHLKGKASVIITSRTDHSREANELGVKFGTLDDVTNCQVIIISVPMEKFTEVLKGIRNKVKPGTIVLDVCSLKLFACRAMTELLPKNVEIIGTHPLFGPQSARDSIRGCKIALCQIKSKLKTFKAVGKFCRELGLDVYITTPEEHDRQMAKSQALTHFIGQAVKKLDIEDVFLSTKTFADLVKIVRIIKNDTPALFENMQTMNPYAKNIRDNFIKESVALNKRLNSKK